MHQKPPRVESIFPNYPRDHYIYEFAGGAFSALGVLVEPDFKWETLIEHLKAATEITASLLDESVNTWYLEYEKWKLPTSETEYDANDEE